MKCPTRPSVSLAPALLAAAITLFGAPPRAEAAQVVVDFEGVVDAVPLLLQPHLPWSEGTAISVHMVYDSDTPDADPNAQIGRFDDAVSSVSLVFHLPVPVVLQFEGLGIDTRDTVGTLRVSGDNPEVLNFSGIEPINVIDVAPYLPVAVNSGGLGTIAFGSLELRFDTNAAGFASGTLPAPFPGLAYWDGPTAPVLDLVIGNVVGSRTVAFATVRMSLSGIESTVVPVPPAIALLASALCALGLARRRAAT